MGSSIIFKIKGFTLAEVILTLTIVGSVASFTIPAMIQNVQDAYFKVAMKEKYSQFTQAFSMLRTNNGGTLEGLFEQGNVNSIFYHVKKPLNIVSSSLTVTDGPNADWLDYCNYNYLNGTSGGYTYKCSSCTSYTMADGSMFMPRLDWTYNDINTCNQTGTYPRGGLCFNVVFDVNGKRAPNVLGKDIYVLAVYRDKTIPADWSARGSVDISTCTPSSSGAGCGTLYMMQ